MRIFIPSILIQMVGLVDKGMKTVIITVLHVFQELEEEQKLIRDRKGKNIGRSQFFKAYVKVESKIHNTGGDLNICKCNT